MQDEQFNSLFKQFVKAQRIMKWAENILVLDCLLMIIIFYISFSILNNDTLGVILINCGIATMFLCILVIIVFSFISGKNSTLKINNYIKEKYNINKIPNSPTINFPAEYNAKNIIQILKNAGFKKIHENNNVITARRKFWPLSLLKLTDLFLLVTNRLGGQTIRVSKDNEQITIAVDSLYPGINYATMMELVSEISPNFKLSQFNSSTDNEKQSTNVQKINTALTSNIKEAPRSRLKISLIALALICASLLPKFITGIQNAKIQKEIVPKLITEASIFKSGSMMENGKIYKIFETSMTEDQSKKWLVGGDVLNGIFYTKCSENFKDVPCGSYNLINNSVEIFDFSKYKNLIKTEMGKLPDYQFDWDNLPASRDNYLISTFVREHATNLITKAGIMINRSTGTEIDPNKARIVVDMHIDYRTDNYDYIISCDPLRINREMTVATRGMYCIIINKRNGNFSDGKNDKVVIPGYIQPQGLTILEKSLIWQQYNKETSKTEYFIYNIE